MLYQLGVQYPLNERKIHREIFPNVFVCYYGSQMSNDFLICPFHSIGSRFHSNSPLAVLNAVYFFDSSSIGIWKYPEVRSNIAKYFGFFFANLSDTCFMFGNGHPLKCIDCNVGDTISHWIFQLFLYQGNVGKNPSYIYMEPPNTKKMKRKWSAGEHLQSVSSSSL